MRSPQGRVDWRWLSVLYKLANRFLSAPYQWASSQLAPSPQSAMSGTLIV